MWTTIAGIFFLNKTVFPVSCVLKPNGFLVSTKPNQMCSKAKPEADTWRSRPSHPSGRGPGPKAFSTVRRFPRVREEVCGRQGPAGRYGTVPLWPSLGKSTDKRLKMNGRACRMDAFIRRCIMSSTWGSSGGTTICSMFV